ncbi:hypothetical protein GCM10025868_46430 [Angustibacter aerolatus]|uniref:ABC transmembrane type-1 domain-containing protein n=1 Tax=Angustibacter aerolatus TaxID=1162965 RepID=A0ABQ6JMY1_9ACTN|nr:hypothetical protein GCM10025868_46430 [Angustibacter aerolatus]
MKRWLTVENLVELVRTVGAAIEAAAYSVLLWGMGPIWPVLVLLLFTDWNPAVWADEHAGAVFGWALVATSGLLAQTFLLRRQQAKAQVLENAYERLANQGSMMSLDAGGGGVSTAAGSHHGSHRWGRAPTRSTVGPPLTVGPRLRASSGAGGADV